MIATYTERLIQVTRVFTLHPDRVEIRARWLFRGQFETRIPLASLSPEHTTIRIRYKLLKHAILALAAGVGVVALGRHWSQPLAPPSPLIWFGCGLTAAGFLVAALTARKVTFVRFRRKDGRPGLDIGRSGPQVAEFDEFVRTVRRQILSAT